MEIQAVSSNLQAAIPVDEARTIGLATAIAATPVAGPPPTVAQVKQAVEKINEAAQKLGSNVQFSVDANNQHVVVKVINQDTHEVIRQMPTLEALEIAKAIDRSQGLVIRDRA